MRAALDGVVATLMPPVFSPTDPKPSAAALGRYRKQANTDAEVVLSAGERDVGMQLPPRRPFDDADNRAFTAKAEQVMHDFKIEVPAVTRALLEQNRTTPLAGPPLELLAELENGQIKLLVTAVRPPAKR